MLRNIADRPESIDMVFQEIGSEQLLNSLSQALESDNDDVRSQVSSVSVSTQTISDSLNVDFFQAVYLLGNLANSKDHQSDILAHPRILASLRECLVDVKVEVRRPAAACVYELVHTDASCFRYLHDAGIDSTLKHICEYGSSLLASSPVTRFGMGFHMHMGVEDDREVKEKAREALHLLEEGGEMGRI